MEQINNWLPLIMAFIIGAGMGVAITYVIMLTSGGKSSEIDRLDEEARNLERGFRE